VCLARARGQVVSRDEFMDSVWANMVVTDDVLARCISELRKILGDQPNEPRYIETIRKSGYRLLPAVVFDATIDTAAYSAAYSVASTAAHSVSDLPFASPPDIEADAVSGTRTTALPDGADSGSTNGSSAAALLPPPHPISSALPSFAGQHRPPWTWSLLGVAFMLGVFLVYHRMLDPSPAQPSVLPFTSLPGEEVDPALSPDGESIVFASNGGSGDNFELYIKQVGGEASLQLTRSPGNERDPIWSPDGRQVAFIRERAGTTGIYLTPSLGGSERELATFGARDVQGMTWSPDGSMLVLSIERSPHGVFALYEMPIETLALRERTFPPNHIYGDLSPTFSPDGDRIAFVRALSPPVQDIYTIARRDSLPSRLTRDNTEINGIEWDPSGRHILYSSLRGGMSNLWRIALLGGRPIWVATAGYNAHLREPSIDRSGARIAFERRTSYTDLWQLHRSQQPRPLIVTTRWDSDPAIAPDGSRIAFVSTQSGSREIWIADADGANAFQRTTLGDGIVSTPRWSPDGASLAFVHWRNGHADVYRIDAVAGMPHPIAASPADELAPAWSRDGRWIYYASNANERWRIVKSALPVSPDTSATPPADSLAHPPIDSVYTVVDGIAAMESEDGTVLFFMKPHEAGIWQFFPEADSSAIVVPGVVPLDQGNWSVVGNGLYFIDRSTTRSSISYFSLTTRRITPIAALGPTPQGSVFAVSPDGRWFIYAQTERIESDILLIDNN